MQLTSMQQTAAHCEFWNDSCDLEQLKHAVSEGAVGATSNPVLVDQAIAKDPQTWQIFITKYLEHNPEACEDEIAWEMIKTLGQQASKLLFGAFEQSGGLRGKLSLQVNPKYFASTAKMVEHGKELAQIAPNIAIKVPAIATGIAAMEELTAAGITINATVSYSVAQAVAAAEAVERGYLRAQEAGTNTAQLTPYVTLMVGRIDDHLARYLKSDSPMVDPGVVHWAGVAVFKKAHEIFAARKYRSKLLAAAYRHHLQWSQLIGPNVVLSIPYKWWNLFNASDLPVVARLEDPVPAQVLQGLQKFPDFVKLATEDGLQPREFAQLGASRHTLHQFISGLESLHGFIRTEMIGAVPT